MSKSIGNLVTVEELIEQKRTAAFRLQVLQSHYRAPLTFMEEGLEAAHRGLDRIRAALDATATASEPAPFDSDIVGETCEIFQSSMDDGFDTPTAITALFNLARAINRSAGRVGSDEQVQAARDKARDRYLLGRHIPVMRFTGSEVWRAPDECVQEIVGYFEEKVMPQVRVA
jgi:cysteinyl-tRNA synthetase